MFCTFTCMHPYFTSLSFSFFPLVFFFFFKRGYCSDSHARFTCTHYNTHALAHYTLFTTFVLSIFILTLSYTHSLLSPCFSFFLSFSFFSFFGLVAHTQSLDIGDSRRGASMALAFSSTPLAPTELEDATTPSPSTLVTPDVGPPWPLRSRRLPRQNL